VNFALDPQLLNTATKYPSIPTYHKMLDRGLLGSERVAFPASEEVLVYEKIDGCNGRLTVLPNGDWLLGSREEWLTCDGDRLANPALGMAEALSPFVKKLAYGLFSFVPEDTVYTAYFELYGGRETGSWRHYATEPTPSIRFFDVSSVSCAQITGDREALSRWRDQGGQTFLKVEDAAMIAISLGVGIAPFLGPVVGQLPTTHAETLAFLVQVAPHTRCSLDDTSRGKAEGVILRTRSRSVIAKLRFEDYERTLRRVAKEKPVA
jgi:hypothetical protein